MPSLAPHHVLGVPASADPVEVRRAYRQRAFELHPDRNDAPGAHDAFLALRAAYESLTGPASAPCGPVASGPVQADGSEFGTGDYDPAGLDSDGAEEVVRAVAAAARAAWRSRRRRWSGSHGVR